MTLRCPKKIQINILICLSYGLCQTWWNTGPLFGFFKARCPFILPSLTYSIIIWQSILLNIPTNFINSIIFYLNWKKINKAMYFHCGFVLNLSWVLIGNLHNEPVLSLNINHHLRPFCFIALVTSLWPIWLNIVQKLKNVFSPTFAKINNPVPHFRGFSLCTCKWGNFVLV